MSHPTIEFQPQNHEAQLLPLIGELQALDDCDPATLKRLLKRYPKEGRGFFSKSDIVCGFRYLSNKHGWPSDGGAFLEKIRKKPVRTLSGVAPVTVLTEPYPCPGRCIFCPSDVRMPKSYLADEPGAQRAAYHRFDPYEQTFSRLRAFDALGHRADKIELIILGGTWSFYPEPYQIWFVKRCFDALNDFGGQHPDSDRCRGGVNFDALRERVDGRTMRRTYNHIVSQFRDRQSSTPAVERARWSDLHRVQKLNETARARCVGMVVETRPDHLLEEEIVRIRRLGATKVQIGIQSLSDKVLALNRRGHDVAATRRAMRRLRRAGFKIHAHWMPNLYGSSPADDIEDFERLFSDPGFRPDELKIYPCSLIESAELMRYYEDGRWRPYSHDELLQVLGICFRQTPEYCRLTRVIRDIPGTDIVDGNRTTNFREIVERHLRRDGHRVREIRAREIRSQPLDPGRLVLRRLDYSTAIGQEVFLQLVTREDRLAAFLRLSLPSLGTVLSKPGEDAPPIAEIACSAMIREVHVYGLVVGLGARTNGRSQHSGLGKRLVEQARAMASAAGYKDLAVISSVGTRGYYRGLGFTDGELYQHLELGG